MFDKIVYKKSKKDDHLKVIDKGVLRLNAFQNKSFDFLFSGF